MDIAVDVDDVCCDLMGVWLGHYNRDYKDNLTKDMITDWNMSTFVKPEARVKIYDYIEDPTLYDEIKPIPNARKVIENLRYYNHRIIYVTHSTLGASGRKYQWLFDNGFLNSRKDYVEAIDKSLIRADFLVDDNFDNVIGFRGVGILVNRPWNKKFLYHYRADTWFEVQKIINKLYFNSLERD